jgi:hypothetical protein
VGYWSLGGPLEVSHLSMEGVVQCAHDWASGSIADTIILTFKTRLQSLGRSLTYWRLGINGTVATVKSMVNSAHSARVVAYMSRE